MTDIRQEKVTLSATVLISFVAYSIGNIFYTDDFKIPELVKKENVNGIYSKAGLITFRTANPRFAPVAGSVISLDVFSDEEADMTITFTNIGTGEEYIYTVSLVGGIWQTIVAESKLFKTSAGIQLAEFTSQYGLTVNCSSPFAINNLLWL